MKKSEWRLKSRNHANHADFLNIYKYHPSSEQLFPLHVPKFFKKNIDFNNPNDPLLLQVLPVKQEFEDNDSYQKDPVGDLKSRKNKGIIHKYHGRVLLIATGACAINCRYCFRRHFPYNQNNASAGNWKNAIDYINENPEIHEVILSGGDPLMLSTKRLMSLTNQLQQIHHVKTLRIHSRMPVVSLSRVTDNLLTWLTETSLNKVMVIHSNHAQEFTGIHKNIFRSLRNTETTLLNQSVLLKNINDCPQTLANLSHKLFDLGIIPYYLHMLDKAQGTTHFHVKKSTAINIYNSLLNKLPGYLVPKLVKEISGKSSKTPII